MKKKQRIISPLDLMDIERGKIKKKTAKPPIDAPKTLADNLEITAEYLKVKENLDSGIPIIFVSGNAGTGKTTLIRYIKASINKKSAVVAPTGVAALNVEGVTIHSFFRLPPKIHEEDDIKIVHEEKIYKNLELLIIDEVSMVRCDVMDSIDKFLRKNRNVDSAFGGVQVLLVGDLYQLPPVIPRRDKEILFSKGYEGSFFFDSFVLRNSPITHVGLSSVFRQKDDSFISLLNDIRFGNNVEEALDIINRECCRGGKNTGGITLTCTNKRADEINEFELNKLPSKAITFFGEINGQFSLDENKLPSPMNLKLKTGAHVMFTRNDESKRWVNGSLGIVRDVENGTINVEIINSPKKAVHRIERVTWENYKYYFNQYENKIESEVIGEYIQYPLILAWAVTIHKSQGKTLDKVFVDLGDGAFDSGQVYVALSRCRSLEGIQLARPIRPSEIKSDSSIKNFLASLKGSARFTESFNL